MDQSLKCGRLVKAVALGAVFCVGGGAASGQSFSEIEFWVGSGANQAARSTRWLRCGRSPGLAALR